jgi:hypothetical protein
VDWEVYLKYYDVPIVDKMSDVLMSLGVLSTKRMGNWEIITYSDIVLNPLFYRQIRLYFVHEEDVKKYANLKWADAHYGWEIRKINDGKCIVFDKNEVTKNMVKN